MSLYRPIEEVEEKEESLRCKVQQLEPSQQKVFYQRQSKLLKDPDTYATMNWFCIIGLHHLYLGRYAIFAIELTVFLLALGAILMGLGFGFLILLVLFILELPQLFFSQRIIRNYNYQVSRRVLVGVLGGSTT